MMRKILDWLAYHLCKPRKWRKCRKALCWENSARTRHMNNLSPHMPPSEFERRVKRMVREGCDTAHVFLVNKADGEFAAGHGGYTPDGNLDMMRQRIAYMRKHGLAVVLWLTADDGNDWAQDLAKNIRAKLAVWSCLFRDASAVVIGLEVDEYWKDKAVARRVAEACREMLPSRIGIGVHQKSDKYDYAVDNAYDFCCYQCNTKLSTAEIVARVKHCIAKLGKPVNAFEVGWDADKERSKAMFDAGAFGVGIW